MRKNPGIRDVARLAGVSTASVSRALNATHAVSPDVRRKVESAVRALDYVPDAVARAMTVRRTGAIGAVFPTLGNAVFAQGVETLQRTLAGHGYSLVLATSGYDPRIELEQVQNLMSRSIDGLVLRGNERLRELKKLLVESEIPFVNVGSHAADTKFPSIGIDNRKAGYLAASHLTKLGHRDIALFAAPSKWNDRARARIEGIRDAVGEHAANMPDEWNFEVRYSFDDIRQSARALFGLDRQPTGIVCTSDVVALGVLIEADREGIAVPEQVSIVGIGDLELSRHIKPGLTTVHIPTEDMWCRAGEYLVAELKGERPVRHFEFDIWLLERGSTAAPLGSA